MTAIHNDANDAASTQVSLPQFLSDFAGGEDFGEITTIIDPSVDLTIEVCRGEDHDHYHVIRIITPAGEVVSACPHHDGLEVILLREAVEEGCTPCGVCNPIDWRENPPEMEAGQS